jgi:hypothetical protein
LFWIGVDGNTCFWKMAASGAIINVPSYNIGPTKNWHVVATGDICSNLGYGGVSDGISDIVWEGYENGSKRKVVWQISPNFKINGAYLSRLDNLAIKGVGDYDADGNAEMLAQDNTKIGYAKITSGTVGGGLEFSGTFTAIGSVPEAEPIPQYSGGFDLELHSNRQFESRLRPTADFSIYNIPDGGNVNFNKSRLFSNLDLSGLVMGACPRGFFCGGGGVAIGKRWVMFATHVYNQKEYGELIYFVDPENKIHWSKILGFYKVGGDSTDITLAYLSTDLPPSVKIYSVLPSKMEALYRSNFGRIPVFTRNQFGKLIVFDRDPQLRFNPINSLNDRPSLRRSLDIERAYFSRQLIVGDSGNPVFIVVDDEPVLTGLLWESYGEGGYSSNVSANIDLINNIMASRGGERLKVFSLDKFIQH